MSTHERAQSFSLYVGLELKGAISSRQTTAVAVATRIGRSPAAFNRWLNGKVEIPLSVVCEACEVIDVEPSKIVETAYDRMVLELGERSTESAPTLHVTSLGEDQVTDMHHFKSAREEQAWRDAQQAVAFEGEKDDNLEEGRD